MAKWCLLVFGLIFLLVPSYFIGRPISSIVIVVILASILVAFLTRRLVVFLRRRSRAIEGTEISSASVIEGVEISRSRAKWCLLLFGLIFLLVPSYFIVSPISPIVTISSIVIVVILASILVAFLTRRLVALLTRRSRAIEGTEISSASAIEGVEISRSRAIEGVEILPTHSIEAAPDDFNGHYLRSLTGLPTIFSFQALDTATGSFSKEIGRGGFGKVYQGTLTDGTQVAVKCLLSQTGHGQREFCAEIVTISSLNHSNLVSLRGVCVEGPHRILVFEFMPNGSLDTWLFASDRKLDWKTRYSIALDTARGLAYLHEESRLGILHLDVKPQNILLDEDFKAKVSDFGMARSLNRDYESRVVTGVRGTPGYMAPEWFMGWGITYKTDVFSYGMVLLEIIRGSKNVDNSQDSENWYFPSVAFKKARQGKMDELIESGLKLKRPEEMDEAYRLIKTALWCIQSNSAMRPSMGTVVRLLEGDLELMDPPLACTLPFVPSLDDDTQPDLDC